MTSSLSQQSHKNGSTQIKLHTEEVVENGGDVEKTYKDGSRGPVPANIGEREDVEGEKKNRKQLWLSSGSPKLLRKVNTRVSLKDIIRRNKSSKNGFPGMISSHSLDVDYSPASSTCPTTLEPRGLSAAIDRTYNAMLQSKVVTSRPHSKTSLQSRIYNFLERPTGWKCFIYHFTV